MNLVNIKDVLTSFSPALDYLALSTGDGRIKVPFTSPLFVVICLIVIQREDLSAVLF